MSITDLLNAKDLPARVIVLLSFAVLTYFTAYRPEFQKQRFVDPYASATLRAANLGHPFTFALETETPSASQMVRFNKAHVDPGLPVLLSCVSVAGRFIFGASYQIDDLTIYRTLFALFLFTALVFVLPGLPFPLAVSGVLALYVCIVSKPGFFANPRLWGATLAALLAAMLIGAATLPGKRRALPFLFGLGALVGLAQFIRQESLLVIFGAAAALICATLLLLLAALLVLPTSRFWWQTSRLLTGRVAISVGLFLIFLPVGVIALRGIYSLAWGDPYRTTTIGTHGLGHNPYLGLGYVNNPYNIAWLDNIGEMQVELFAPGISFFDESYQDIVWRECLRLSSENPGLVLENIIAKGSHLRNGLKLLLCLAAPTVVIAVILASRSQRLEPYIMLAGFGGLFVASLVSPLLVYPAYASAMFGTLVSTFTILPTALWVSAKQSQQSQTWATIDTQLKRRILWGVLLTLFTVMILGGLAGLVWYVRQEQNRSKALQEFAQLPNPLSRLRFLEYRFGHLFNQLPVSGQDGIISELKRASSMDVYYPDLADRQVHNLLTPVLAVFTPTQLHIIVWLGRNDDPEMMPHGDVSYFLTVCKECVSLPNTVLHERNRSLSIGINNLFWGEGRYRMYSFAIDLQMKQTQWLQIALQKVVGPGPGGWNYILETKSSTRLGPETPNIILK